MTTEQDLLQQCHHSGQMGADQSVAHARAGEITASDIDQALGLGAANDGPASPEDMRIYEEIAEGYRRLQFTPAQLDEMVADIRRAERLGREVLCAAAEEYMAACLCDPDVTPRFLAATARLKEAIAAAREGVKS